MYITHSNHFEGVTIGSGYVMGFNGSVVCEPVTIRTVVSAGTAINAGAKLGFWELEGSATET